MLAVCAHRNRALKKVKVNAFAHTGVGAFYILHSKSWISWMEKSADDFEFSAERLSENAKSIKITLFAELLTAISPIYVQSLLNLSIKTLKHTICSTKMPH